MSTSQIALIIILIIVYTLFVVSAFIAFNKAGRLRIDTAFTEDLETKGRISFSFDPIRIGKKKYVVFEVVDTSDKLSSLH